MAGRPGQARAARTRRVVVVTFVLALSIGGAACDDNSGSESSAEQGKVEMQFRPPPRGYREETLPEGSAHTLVCPSGKPDCTKPTAVAAVGWADGESSFTVLTANGRPTDAVPTPDDFLSRSPGNDGNGQRVTVRGHPGVLYLADAADFTLLWRERPGVWVRMDAEDVTHSKPEILGIARSLQAEPWPASESATG